VPRANVHSLGTNESGGGSLRGGGSASASTRGSTIGGSKAASDGASASGTSLLHLGSAGTRGRGTGDLLGGAVEAAGLRRLAIHLVVAVHGECETLGLVAHGIGAVGTLGTVAGNTVEDSIRAAEVGEGLGVLLVGDIVDGDAVQGAEHALTQVGVGRGRELASGEPVGADGGASLADGGRDGVAGAVHTARRGGLHLLGQVAVVGQGGDGVAIGRDQTVVVAGVEVHVDDTTAPDVVHLGTEQDGHVGELTRARVVAAVLGEESGHGVVLELLSAGLVTGGLVARVTAPLVDVVTEHVNGVAGVIADQVLGNVVTDSGIIVSSVTNCEGRAVVLLLDVGLQVTNGGLDVGHGVGVFDRVSDLVTGKETDDVGVLGECINDLGVAGEEVGVPRRVLLDNGLVGRGQISDDIDTRIGQGAHALVVVLGWVDSVGADDIGSEADQIGDIALAALGIGQRVNVVIVTAGAAITGAVVGLVGDTTDVELGAVVGVEELLALNFNGGHRGHSRSQEGQAGENGVFHRKRV